MRSIPESAYTSKNPHDLNETHRVRIAAISCSSVSILASTIAFCWFGRMEKRFRHRLIMILFYGDFVRSCWYFIFTLNSHVRGQVQTQTTFCQISGFFLQYGIETSDYAVLVIAIHSAIQVFRPANRGNADLFHRYRYSIFAGAVILPGLMAGLAFVNSRWGYFSQGAYCMLPIRPLWYLLALTWIPRYIIILTIFGLAIAIYAYVGFEFRSYAGASRGLKTPITTTDSILSEQLSETRSSRRQSNDPCYNQRRASSIAHEILSSQQKDCSVTFASDRTVPNRPLSGGAVVLPSLPESSHQDRVEPTLHARIPLFTVPSGLTIRQIASSPTLTSQPLACQSSLNLAPARTASFAEPSSSSSRSPSPMSSGQRHLVRQRKRVHRQMRLMFIYPLVYSLMWLLPFVHHCMQYNDYFAARPIFFFRIGATICISSMGFVDCLIFSIREKPWRSISTSDGTFWGSFVVWRKPKSSESDMMMLDATGGGRIYNLNNTMENTGGSMIGRIRSSVRTSASDDYTRMAAEQARLRLDMEKEARMAAFRERKLRPWHSGSLDELRMSSGGSEGNGNIGEERTEQNAVSSTKGKGKERAGGPRHHSVDF